MRDLLNPLGDIGWLREVPLTMSWTLGRDDVFMLERSVHVHPFMLDQLGAAGDHTEWLRRIQARIEARIDAQARHACQNIDRLVDTLNA